MCLKHEDNGEKLKYGWPANPPASSKELSPEKQSQENPTQR